MNLFLLLDFIRFWRWIQIFSQRPKYYRQNISQRPKYYREKSDFIRKIMILWKDMKGERKSFFLLEFKQTWQEEEVSAPEITWSITTNKTNICLISSVKEHNCDRFSTLNFVIFSHKLFWIVINVAILVFNIS